MHKFLVVKEFNDRHIIKGDLMESMQSIRPSDLLNSIGYSPADNCENLKTALPWKSKMGGTVSRQIFQYQQFLDGISENFQVFGPLAIAANWQSQCLKAFVTEPVKTHARIAVRAGKEPDVYRDMNGWIYKNYARTLYDLCGYFMKDGKFDRKKAGEVSMSPEGRQLLRDYVQEFGQMEHQYNALGLTRLKAMKELLACLLVVITETPLDGSELPFIRKNKDGTDGMSFDAYLDENRFRLECLYNANAFDAKEYAERATHGRIGFSKYRIVPGSELHTVRLRHYTLPKGIKPNGNVLYMSTPLINRPELFDLAEGKSVVEGMHREGYDIYLVDYGEAGIDEANLGLDFFGKTVHDRYLKLIQARHPHGEISILGYCMGGALMMPYLARRAEEKKARGEEMDIKKIVMMAAPVRFDDDISGHGSMRAFIRQNYDAFLMKELFGAVNVPPQIIDFGMNEIQPGVHYTLLSGFYGRAIYPNAIEDSAPFLYWLTHGTRFPAKAHRDWLEHFFMGNELVEGTYRLPSSIPALDGKPVRMEALAEAEVTIFDYRGARDPIAPPGSCVASELWGLTKDCNLCITTDGLNRTIEKNIGHIFVVSKQLLAEFLQIVAAFLRGEKT
jgi:pimeloyl-ACP methyl ester carboxylesterase